jgi:hypothetical protein
MFIRAVMGFSALAAAISTAHAENKFVYGAGTISCGEWQKHRSTRDKPSSYQAQAWIDGYLPSQEGVAGANAPIINGSVSV